MLLCNARIVTLDPLKPFASAVAICGDRIAAVGTERECAPFAEGDRIDLDGATVVPGLVDAHGHLLGLGIFLSEIDLVGTESEAAAVERVRAAALEGDGWLRGFGWDQSRWNPPAFPTLGRLSRAVPHRPVWLSRIDGHAAWVNAAALRLAGIDRRTPDPPGGRIVRDEGGEPTGVLIDEAMKLVERCIPPMGEAERERRILEACTACAEVGLTGVHDAGVDAATLATLRRLDEAGRLPLRTYAMVETRPETLEGWLRQGPWQGDRLTVRCVKFFLDGALGSRGAALDEPYDDDPCNRGLLLLEEEAFVELLVRSRDAGFQVAVHAIGDRATRMALDGFVRAGLQPTQRPRLEHAEILRPDDRRRAAALGVIASMQPTHCTSDMPWIEARLGRRVEHASPWRSTLEAGCRLALGSDFPIESPDPRKGIYAAITRQDERGHPPGGFFPAERLTAEQALRGFTTGAAFAAFREHESGRIAPGHLADLTVLDRNPLEVPAPEILRARVLRTIVAGRTLFAA